ncbi:MAG: hypothetical protein CM1200mP2_31800 [Planctomycetaceae bacterium]|nr:MAG: hypothetical protein CM1200mP2_31800 [Planctomycetaceae bacterium]
MVVADHISGDHRLINYGTRMCTEGGSVWLCHVEDDMVFQRFVQAIEQIPEITSEPGATLLEEQLLKEARDFIETCFGTLRETGPNVSLKSHVAMGHHVTEYRRLVERTRSSCWWPTPRTTTNWRCTGWLSRCRSN